MNTYNNTYNNSLKRIAFPGGLASIVDCQKGKENCCSKVILTKRVRNNTIVGPKMLTLTRGLTNIQRKQIPYNIFKFPS